MSPKQRMIAAIVLIGVVGICIAWLTLIGGKVITYPVKATVTFESKPAAK